MRWAERSAGGRRAGFWGSATCPRLRCDTQVIVQELGGEVGSVAPDQCVELGMNLELAEDGGAAQGGEVVTGTILGHPAVLHLVFSNPIDKMVPDVSLTLRWSYRIV